MTKQEDGAQIAAMADSVVRAINGAKGQAAGALADASNFLSACKSAAEEKTSEVARICGEDDPATQAIVGNTANVSEAVENCYAAVETAIGMLEAISNAAAQLGFAYQNVGADIQRAGGGQ
ncbi:MAG TPA: hypothetical protein VJQ25_09315 [Nitrospira sp.]|nr:hypothetical protein [Nitrospira sp.]